MQALFKRIREMPFLAECKILDKQKLTARKLHVQRLVFQSCKCNNALNFFVWKKFGKTHCVISSTLFQTFLFLLKEIACFFVGCANVSRKKMSEKIVDKIFILCSIGVACVSSNFAKVNADIDWSSTNQTLSTCEKCCLIDTKIDLWQQCLSCNYQFHWSTVLWQGIRMHKLYKGTGSFGYYQCLKKCPLKFFSLCEKNSASKLFLKLSFSFVGYATVSNKCLKTQ